MLCFTRISESESAYDDALCLPFDLRQKCLQKVRLASGRMAALMLPRGTILRDGLYLHPEDDSVCVRVKAADERVSIIECNDSLLLARACYHLGNRHVPVQIANGAISYLHDHVLDAMLQGLGLSLRVESRPFEPEAGAYAQATHAHHH